LFNADCISLLPPVAPQEVELLALCDISQVRMNEHNRQLQELGHPRVKTYLAAEFDRMIAPRGRVNWFDF